MIRKLSMISAVVLGMSVAATAMASATLNSNSHDSDTYNAMMGNGPCSQCYCPGYVLRGNGFCGRCGHHFYLHGRIPARE